MNSCATGRNPVKKREAFSFPNQTLQPCPLPVGQTEQCVRVHKDIRGHIKERVSTDLLHKLHNSGGKNLENNSDAHFAIYTVVKKT